jgi:hypothetical protein
MDYLHPEVLVVGENYPLPPLRQLISTVVSFLQTALLIVAIGGRFIPAINNHPLYQQVQ